MTKKMVFCVKKMATLGGVGKKYRNSSASSSTSAAATAAAASAAINSTLYNPNITIKKEKIDYIPKFKQEISDIMRGYGDCEKPLPESIILVEKIVLEQMRSLLNDAINLAMNRCGRPQPLQRDFEFMLRRAPTKLFRFQKYLKDLELKRRYEDMLGGRPMTYSEDFDEDNFEEPEEVPEKLDEEKVRRVFRANRISLLLNSKQYAEYNEARRTSFHYRNSATIRAKLYKIVSPPADAIISGHVYTILGYLVHETIATIVDYAILTRLDSLNRDVHPLSRLSTAGMSSAMMYACPEVTQGRGQDGVKPITPAEIQEAVRRHNSGYEQKLGMYRNIIDRRTKIPYLAL